jgi:hypothetical protein
MYVPSSVHRIVVAAVWALPKKQTAPGSTSGPGR